MFHVLPATTFYDKTHRYCKMHFAPNSLQALCVVYFITCKNIFLLEQRVCWTVENL